MSSSSGVEKKITLKSSDGKTLEVEETVAMESQMIKQMVDDNRKCAGGTVIELPKLTSVILLKVFEYCKKHVEARGEKKDDKLSENELRTWDREFMKVDQQTLFDLVLAAHYLHIINLVDLTCQTVADMLRGKTAEEIRKAFNIPENFTPEEEERIRRENPWAF